MSVGSKPMTVKDYADKILKPTVLSAIANGAVDNAITDPDVLEMLLDDKEVMTAIHARLEVIRNKTIADRANQKVIDAHKADNIWNAAIDAVLNLKRIDEYAAEDIRRLKR